MTIIIGLTGLAGSGKSEISKHLLEKHGFSKLVFSDILREEAAKRRLLEGKSYEEQKFALSKLGEVLRKESGRMDILAVKLVEKIVSGNYDNIIVDGFRSAEEVNLFRKNFDDFYLVLVETDENIRFNRRKMEDPSITIENIRSRDKRDIEELGLSKVIEMADFKVENNDSISSLHEEIDNIVEGIIG